MALPWIIYRNGELICPTAPGFQAYTPPELISNLNHNKIKLIPTLRKQKNLTALLNSKILLTDYLTIFMKLRTLFGGRQTLANNSTPPRYSKNIHYSAINRGQIVGQIVAQYSTQLESSTCIIDKSGK